jgi:hypothetical protein
MRHHPLAAVFVTVATLAAAAACHSPREEGASEQGGFEGTVQMVIPGNAPRGVAFSVKGHKVRWDLVPGDPNGGFRVYDDSSRRLSTVEPQVPAVLVSDVAAPSAGEDAGVPWSFVTTSTDSVAGYPCDRVRVTGGERIYDVCAARGLPALPLEYALGNAQSEMPFLGALAARGQVPLAVVVERGDAGVSASVPKLVTTAVQRGPQDAARFDVPKFPERNVRIAAPRALPR